MSASTITKYPLVTVLMCVYNSETYLREAIESILNQSFKEFEFLIINDASIDRSLEIIKHYDNTRIKIIQNSENIGLTKSLNKGLKAAEGKYIARMDADDISHPQRLERQVKFMEEHPEVGICGTWFQLIGQQERIIKHPVDHQDILTFMFKNNGIGHPTAFIRKDLFIEQHLFYDENYTAAQDYDLWVRASQKIRLANIPEVLVKYRVHSSQVSIAKLQQQRYFAFKARCPLIYSLVEQLPDKALSLYKDLLTSSIRFKPEEVKLIVQLINKMIYTNAVQKLYNQTMLHGIFFEQYRMLVSRIEYNNFASICALKQSIFFRCLKFSRKAKLFINIFR